MARVERNREFLARLVVSNKKTRSMLIHSASDDQIKTIFEIIYNINSIPFTAKEQKKLVKYKKFLKSFIKRKWTLNKLRVFFNKEQKIVSILIDGVQSKIVDGVICSILSDA